MTLTHQAEVYEMNTAQRPDKTIAKRIENLDSGGKLAVMLAEDQSSVRMEDTPRIGIAKSSL